MKIFMLIMFILTINLAFWGNLLHYFFRQKGQGQDDYRVTKYYFKQADTFERIGAGGTIALILVLMFSAILFV